MKESWIPNSPPAELPPVIAAAPPELAAPVERLDTDLHTPVQPDDSTAEQAATAFDSLGILTRIIAESPQLPEFFGPEDTARTAEARRIGVWASRAYSTAADHMEDIKKLTTSPKPLPQLIDELVKNKTRAIAEFKMSSLSGNMRADLSRSDMTELEAFGKVQIPDIVAHLQTVPLSPEIRIIIEADLAVLDQYLASRGGIVPNEEYPVFAELALSALQILADQETRVYQTEYREHVLQPAIDFLAERFPALSREELATRASRFTVRLESTVGVNLAAWDAMDGYYSTQKREIIIPRSRRGDRHVETHETLHALSHGDSEKAAFTDQSETQDRLGGIGPHLTEAVVETVTREIIPEAQAKKKEIYNHERWVLEHLQTWQNFPGFLDGVPRPGSETGPIPLDFFIETLFSKPKSLGRALIKRGYSAKDVDVFLDSADLFCFPMNTEARRKKLQL